MRNLNRSASSTRLLEAFRGRLAKLPIANHPALHFCPGLEGYKAYTFGGRAGPSLHISHLLHELAHAAEFGPEGFISLAIASWRDGAGLHSAALMAAGARTRFWSSQRNGDHREPSLPDAHR